MFGPGYGHNAQSFIDFFNKQQNFQVTYICRGSTHWRSSKFVNILTYQKSFTQKIKKILNDSPSVVWVHGGYDLQQLIQIRYYSHSKNYLSLNVWGDQVPLKIKSMSLKGIIYRLILRRFHQIHCNWYGTYEILQKSHKNVIVHPWGLERDFIESNRTEPLSFTKNFINRLPGNKYLFFYPKSILSVSAHKEILQACLNLTQDGESQFQVYFWVGNSNDSKLTNDCLDFITQHKLESVVELVEHPFLPVADIQLIWQKMNCGLQLAKSDQLSTTFLEPQFLKKEIIASDIYPYQKYNALYSSELELLPIDAQKISQRMKSLINRHRATSKTILEKRSDLVLDKFSFEQNVIQRLHDLKSLASN